MLDRNTIIIPVEYRQIRSSMYWQRIVQLSFNAASAGKCSSSGCFCQHGHKVPWSGFPPGQCFMTQLCPPWSLTL
jgi:hypothetical protein